MKKLWLIKLFITSSISIVFLLSFFSYSQNISILTWENKVKMFCKYSRTITFDKEWNANQPKWVILFIDFDKTKLNISDNDFSFSNLFPTNWINPSLVNWKYWTNSRLSAQRWWKNNILPNSWNVWILTFSSKKTLSWKIEFYTSWQWFTDRVNDTDLYYNNWEDMLVKVNNASYKFYTWLCERDYASPKVINFYPRINSNIRQVWYWPYTLWPIQNIPEKIYAKQWLKFKIIDWESYTKTQPWYTSWNYPNLDFQYYQANTNPWTFWPLNVADRSSWVDPNSFLFRFSNFSTIFNRFNTIITWQNFTRDRKHRDYEIKINSGQIQDFWIENPITFSWYAKDFSWKELNFQYLFNPAISPRITNINPYNWQEQILPLTDIFLRIRDDRAWVNSGNIKITIKSWNLLLWEFTWNKLNLNPISWDANYPDFNIHIKSWEKYQWQPLIFPIPTWLNIYNTITVQVETEDLKWNKIINPYNTYSFKTRYSCQSYPWCWDPLSIYFPHNTWRIHYLYTYNDLFVYSIDNVKVDSWNKTLFCWNSSWNIIMHSFLENEENFENPQEYTEKNIYISWTNLNVSINWNELIIQWN